MQIRKFIVVALLAITVLATASETDKSASANKKGHIIGLVIDSGDGKPVEYATIALYKKQDKQLVTGGISDSEGFFRLKNNPTGEYYLTITFMGYKTKTIPGILILDDTREIELGNVMIDPNIKELEAVNVIADQASVQYKIDKKVVNVSQQLNAKSGTAVDILENIPSVKVDIEGNVTLRGSGSFTVLIDGRPTALEPSDALRQIPAGAIDNIEIITNPSAKYEPDGASGIVNIITKKNKLNGMSGIVNANAGRFSNYGGDFTVDYRNDKIHLYVGGDYNSRNMPGDLEYNRDTRLNADSMLHLKSNGNFARSRSNSGIRAGIDWSISEADNLGINGMIGNRSMAMNSEKNYDEWINPIGIHDLYQTDDVFTHGGLSYSATLNYKHTFNKNREHFLEAQIITDGRQMDEESLNKIYRADTISEARKTIETGPYNGLRFKLDYSQPFDWGGKFEAGFQSQITDSKDENKVYEYNFQTDDYELQDKYSNNTNYTRNTYATYGILGGEYGDFGYQAGLRMEYTYRLLEVEETNEEYKIERPDFFPTLHFSYNLPADQQIMASYTKRIERPRGYYLEPFITWRDANNVRQGNPELEPEYINSFDLGYQKKFQKKNFFSLEGYYRITENKIERVMKPYPEQPDAMLRTFENVGKDFALGVEAMINYSPTKWYTANLMADFYDYKLEVVLYDIETTQHDFSWNSRFNNTFKISPNTRLQIDFSYQSPAVRAQGKSAGFFSSSAALKQDFLKRKVSATLQVRDVFGTWKHEFESAGTDFYQYTLFSPNTPIVMLTVSYKINNYKIRKKRGGGSDMDAGGDVM